MISVRQYRFRTLNVVFKVELAIQVILDSMFACLWNVVRSVSMCDAYVFVEDSLNRKMVAIQTFECG